MGQMLSPRSVIGYFPTEGDSTYHIDIDLVRDVPHSFGFGFRFDSQEAAAILLGLGINEQKLTGVKFNFSTRLSYNPWVTVRVSFAPRAFPKVQSIIYVP